MSCQQASRLTEDPYAFTEPTTIIQTGSIYQSSLLNREKKLPANGLIGAPPITVASPNANGGIHKNSTIYTQTFAKQRQNQQPLTFHSAFSKQFQPTNKLTTGKPVKLAKPASNLPQQQQQTSNQNVLKTNLLVPDNSSKRNLINHSNNSQITPSVINNPASNVRLHQGSSHNLGGQAGRILVHQQSSPSIIATSNSIIPVTTHNTTTLPTTNVASTFKAISKSNVQSLSPVVINGTTGSEVMTNGGQNNITFVVPKQQNGISTVKLSNTWKSTPTTTATTTGIVNNPPTATGPSIKSTSGKRGRRSYSNTSHHETVQRISESSDYSMLAGSAKVKAKPTSSGAVAVSVKGEWHAPDYYSYVYDYTSPSSSVEGLIDTSLLVQNSWYIADCELGTVKVKTEELNPQPGTSSQFQSDSIVNKSVNSDNLLNNDKNTVARDERLQIKRSNLRRKAVQYWSGQNLRNNLASRRRLINVWKVFGKLEQQRKDNAVAEPPLSNNLSSEHQSNKCSVANCNQKPLVMTSFCYQHITCNTEQRLFHSCTAKFSDNTQCQVPVFDISHELPLCTEHAWKRDNYNKMLQEMKPKKPPRKKPKPSAMTRPSKRNKKKKKLQQQQNHHHHHNQQQHQPILPPPQYSTLYPNYNKITPVVQNISNDTISMYHPQQQTQDFLNMCDNSSAYASSEDTGVGGLSESELMVAHDVIEDIPFIETHELTNVLNQIPADAFHELFSEQQNTFEPTQEEQDHLDFVLEAVDKHVKNLEQMTEESTNFLGDFLDNVDEEMLNTDICTDQILQTSSDIRGLVHT